jgi:hypothetical protein
MNKKQLAKDQKVSVSRITQIMKELKFEKKTDYNWKVNERNFNEIVFTAEGVRKIRKRNKQVGRKKLTERVK